MYAWCVDRIAPDKVEEWWYQMNLPLPGHEKKVSDSVAEAEGDSFMALMAQHTANVGSG